MNEKAGDFAAAFLKVFILLLVIECAGSLWAQKKTTIDFSADNIEYDETMGRKARRLIGHVVFKHKGITMYCDSAYQYTELNSLDAYGKVHIEEGDSLDLYCDSLYYNGEDQIFTCKRNVILDNNNIHLTTDDLIYDRFNNLGYYLHGGKIVNRDDASVLTSVRGYYYTTSDEFYFKKEVEYLHADFKILADTLNYDAQKKITRFLGPTHIYSDSSKIYCENGYYDAVSSISEYTGNAVLTSGNRIISGDSIYYNKFLQQGHIRGNAGILDTSEHVKVLGEYAQLYDDRDSAVVSLHTELQQYFELDTLFLHADTFKVYARGIDGGKVLEAYRHVRFFKSDLQGKCDSMVYVFADSAIKMYYDPILWSGVNQITGNYVQLNMVNGLMHSMEVERDAFINSQVDSIHFNQVRGKDMTGYFIENKIDKVFVTGNGQTIYYPMDDDDKYIGVNRGESSDLIIQLKNNEINQISYVNDANATFYPLEELPANELKLKGFSWRFHVKPKNREDIFIWVD